MEIDYKMEVAITLPVYNEASRLDINCRKLHSFLENVDWASLVILAEDGSSDNSFQVATRLSETFERVKVFHADKKLGRGQALRNAWSQVSADVYVFMDADLATDLKDLPRLVALIRENQYDFVTGSRYSVSASTSRPSLRRAISILYNRLVRVMFSTGVTDHQCGFKAFNRKAVSAAIQHTNEDSWVWDTEVIVVLKRLNFRIGEIDIAWKEKKYKRTSFSRLVSDILLHGSGLLRILVTLKRFF